MSARGTSGRSSWVVRQERPDERVLALAMQPDRAALASLAPEAATLRQPLRRLVVRMRSQLESPHSRPEEGVAQEPHRRAHQASLAARRPGEVGHLVVVAMAP